MVVGDGVARVVNTISEDWIYDTCKESQSKCILPPRLNTRMPN